MTLCMSSVALAQQESATTHAEALVHRLGTGNINDEDAAKMELRQHPTPEALAVLVKDIPSSDATVRNDIVDILAAYKDPAKLPALVAYRANGWGEENIDSQFVELGAPAVSALVSSLPDTCDRPGRNSEYADWVGTVLREIEPDGTRAMLAGLLTSQPCMHAAARSGLLVPRPGPPMAPPPTAEDEESAAGLSLLVDAAESEDLSLREAAVSWIHALQNRQWVHLEYSQFLEAVIKAYQSNVNSHTRTAIARLLAQNRCRRVDRFMRAATHSPNAEVRVIAQKYFAPYRASER